MVTARQVLDTLDKYYPEPSAYDRERMNYLAPNNGSALPLWGVLAGLLRDLPEGALAALSASERETFDLMRREVNTVIEVWRNGQTARLGSDGKHADLFSTKLRTLLAVAARFRTDRQRYLVEQLQERFDALGELQQGAWADVRQRAYRLNADIEKWLADEFGNQEAEAFRSACDQPYDGAGIDEGARFLEALAAAVSDDPARFARRPGQASSSVESLVSGVESHPAQGAQDAVVPPAQESPSGLPKGRSPTRGLIRDLEMVALGAVMVAAIVWHREVGRSVLAFGSWLWSGSWPRRFFSVLLLPALVQLVRDASNELLWARVHDRGFGMLWRDPSARRLAMLLVLCAALIAYLQAPEPVVQPSSSPSASTASPPK